MAVIFKRLASFDMIDKPLLNLELKKFTTVELYTFDGVFTFTTDELIAKTKELLGQYCMCYDDIEIELHADYLVWYDEGKENIIPLTSINRWVLE